MSRFLVQEFVAGSNMNKVEVQPLTPTMPPETYTLSLITPAPLVSYRGLGMSG
jgi:hypothetical protein